jgi:hypothetical protein
MTQRREVVRALAWLIGIGLLAAMLGYVVDTVGSGRGIVCVASRDGVGCSRLR